MFSVLAAPLTAATFGFVRVLEKVAIPVVVISPGKFLSMRVIKGFFMKIQLISLYFLTKLFKTEF